VRPSFARQMHGSSQSRLVVDDSCREPCHPARCPSVAPGWNCFPAVIAFSLPWRLEGGGCAHADEFTFFVTDIAESMGNVAIEIVGVARLEHALHRPHCDL